MTAYAGRAIDEDGVLPKKREHPEYKRLYAKLEKELTASNAIENFCAHEAGHLIFFKQAGFVKFDFYGPTMTYDAFKPCKDESERYDYFIAAIHSPEMQNIRHYDGDTLDRLAKGAVAGELFAEVRRGVIPPPVEKNHDFDSFDSHCRKALRFPYGVSYDAKGRWLAARPRVKEYLADPTNETKIQAAIAEVRYECFGLR